MVFGLAHLAVHGACLAASVGASAAAANAANRRAEQMAVQTVPVQYVMSSNGVVHQIVNGQRSVPPQYVIRQAHPHQHPSQQRPQMYYHPQGPTPQQQPQMRGHPQGPLPQQQPQMRGHPQGPLPQQQPQMYSRPQGPMTRQVPQQHQQQHQYCVQSPRVATAARPGPVPPQAPEEENEMSHPPRRSLFKKLLRRFKAGLCCTARNQGEDDEEPMLSGSHGNSHS